MDANGQLQNREARRKTAAEEIYLILAEFFKFPTAEFYDDIRSGRVDEQLRALFFEAGYVSEEIELRHHVGSFEEMKANYSRCFLGMTRPFALPVESVYKVWTTDPTAQVSIANSKGYLMGDSALHIQHLFQQFQLEVPQEYEKMPDHLTILLELLAVIIRERGIAERTTFIRDHFDWLDDFLEALSPVPGHELYTHVTKTVQRCVDNELALCSKS